MYVNNINFKYFIEYSQRRDQQFKLIALIRDMIDEFNMQEQITTKRQKQINMIRQTIQSQNIIFTDHELQCRICLQQMQQNEVIGICKCKGNMSVVHKGCLLQWLKKSKKYKKSLFNYYSICDICKASISLETQIQLKCVQTQNIQLMRDQSCCSMIVITILCIGIILLALSVYVLTQSQFNKMLNTISVVGLIVSLVIIFFDVTIYLFHSVIYFDIIVVGFKPYSCLQIQTNKKKKNKKNQVAPLTIHNQPIQNQNEISMANLQSNLTN